MEVVGASIIKFLGFKRRSQSLLLDLDSKKIKRECLSSSEDKTDQTISYIENEMEVDSTGYSESLFIQLNNGDYYLNNAKIQKNNIFIIPEYLKEREEDDIFKGWRYIDFIIYFRDKCDTKYYDYNI